MSTQQEYQQGDALASDTLRLLLPVDATERSRWGINYAIRQKQSGMGASISLLFVAEVVTDWRVLRFRTREEVRDFQACRGNYFLEDAARLLQQADIPVQTYYREGEIVFEILDIAEQLDCNRIVLPIPHPRWATLFCSDIVREVIRRQRSIPIVTVDSEGIANRSYTSTLAQRRPLTFQTPSSLK